MTHFLATVEFDAHHAPADLANALAQVCGIPLTKDDSGRFDEVPAYVGNTGELQLTLFGPTEDQEERECVLEVSFRTMLSAPAARASSPAFFQPIFNLIDADSTGHINCSSQLATALRMNGFSDCKPVH